MRNTFTSLLSAFVLVPIVRCVPLHPRDGTAHESGGEHYLVLFKHDLNKRSATPPVDDVLTRLELSSDHEDVHSIFNGTMIRGFSANMKSHCLDALATMDDIAYVEKVQTFRTAAEAGVSSNVGTWGLQALSSKPTRIANPRSFDHPYTVAQDSSLGQGADIYILDTGVRTDHVAFAGRADFTSLVDAQTDDEGHGTHVAGTAAGNVFGVAQKANVHGVKVLNADGSGSSVTIAQGMELVANAHEQKKSQPGFVGSVVNLSLNGPKSAAVEQIVSNLNSMGVHVVVAAGNDGRDSANGQDDACNYTPASTGGVGGNAITVGSIGTRYQRSVFSNSGQCVDVYAPGEQIVSSWITSQNSVNTLQGTSMAAPHVAGLVAYNMAKNPNLAQDPAAMKKFIRDTALSQVLTGDTRPGDPRLIANNGFAQ